MRYPRVVYAIQHNETGRIYVGSTVDLERRIAEHMLQLRKGSHGNPYLQKDYDEVGQEFTVYRLDQIANVFENRKEYDWMMKLHTTDPEYGYNMDDRGVRRPLVGVQFKEGLPKRKGESDDKEQHQREAPEDST